jgi:hypothetical protein
MMKAHRVIRVASGALLGVAAICLLLSILPPWLIGAPATRFQVWRFERKLKHTADPARLQEWATNFAQCHPYEQEFYADVRGTNLPPGILELSQGRPAVTNYKQNGETFFSLGWGRGKPSLVIGSPTLAMTNSKAEMWKPGIYIVPPYD